MKADDKVNIMMVDDQQAKLLSYEVILAELGRGGMSVVYKARQVGLDRVVALKMILAGEYAGAQERARFQAEALAVGRLQHPNVVQVFEVGEHNGLPFFSLEFCPGGSLAERLRDSPLAPAAAARLVATLAQAMQAAHEKGILHRDLKPANVLLGEDGSAKVSDAALSATGVGVTATEGATFNGLVATFTDNNAGAPISERDHALP